MTRFQTTYIRGIKHYTAIHTDAQSAKKDVISTKPQKGRASRGPKKHKEAKKHNRTSFPGYPCHMSPFSRDMLSCVSKAGRGGGQSPWSDTRV